MKRLYALIALLMLTACGAPKVEDYAGTTPTLDIRDYLDGTSYAHGAIIDWSGKVSRHFVAKIDGSRKGNQLILDESFTYSDGTTSTRLWTLTFHDDHHFTGTAGDVMGEAEGAQYGHALNFHYTLRVEQEDGSTIDVDVDDWMYLTADGVLLNHSDLTKFGIPVGEVQIAFTRDKHSF